jgi:hypothetical protein
MGSAHYFVVDDLARFRDDLESKHYVCERERDWRVYSKTLSQTLVKYYTFWLSPTPGALVRIRVTYKLLKGGKPLLKLTTKLKALNRQHIQTLPVWKTRRPPRDLVREKRWKAIQKFLSDHHELISCITYPADNRRTEGSRSFNLEIASTPHEQYLYFEFLKALLAAQTPYGLVHGRRQIDKISQQRNGWIKRYAEMHRKRGWRVGDIAREIQKELREGTWSERRKLQYNLAPTTICKIAGIKPTPRSLN